MKDYYFEKKKFIIENYDIQKPFASFLPGIAGLKGIPLWAFYVNRGQGISSFGIRDKNGAILEFYPANSAYMYVDKIGFRTFVKIDNNVFEIFKNEKAKRRMEILPNELSIVEENEELSLIIKVSYFILPNESFAGLVRKVQFTDLSKEQREIEIIDGIAQILPSGIDYGGYKAVSNLLRSWMEVTNFDHNIAFYKLRASTDDSAVVKEVKDGNFYLSFVDDKLIKPITDCDLIFEEDTALEKPIHFKNNSLKSILNEPQVTVNKVPCGFTGVNWNTKLNSNLVLSTIIGYTKDINSMNQRKDIISTTYINQKQEEANKIINELTSVVETKTAFPIFDEYIRQNYLDNLIRGGHPIVFKDEKNNYVYHVYSRKHGDLERDYNFFVIQPDYYSQGNGNFRDVCQNRRNDCLINNQINDYNIYVFGSLIQADGYNPLGVNGSKFTIKPDFNIKDINCQFINEDKLKSILDKKFTPGEIVSFLDEEKLSNPEIETILSKIILNSNQHIEAEFGEGYWQDHWTYILDLIENYLNIYPDKLEELMFNRKDYKYYDSPVYVLPRSDKYVLIDGKVRQYDSILHDHEKQKQMARGSNWLKDIDGKEIETNLFSKLLVLSINKFACLDPDGIGISYEANKPGWNDAMNGLPGLFGSGVGETIELYKLVDFLRKISASYKHECLYLPFDFFRLTDKIRVRINIKNQFDYWDLVTSDLEEYRKNIRFNVNEQIEIKVASIYDLLEKILDKLRVGLMKALEIGEGVYPTYLIYEPTYYQIIKDNDQPKINQHGMINVKVKAFNQIPLPLFLEAPSRALKTNISDLNKKELYHQVKSTEMYDSKLKFYKTSTDLSGLTLEVGRIVAFSKGWFERESNFLHMTYKYLYGLLKAGLYQEFFEEIKTNLVCFMDPATYGRSTIENSSFLAPSNNPNPKLWGQGFVARLSGSTSEVLSMWHMMFFGKDIFKIKNGELVFKLNPILSKEFFNLNGVVSAKLFGKTEIVYFNPDFRNTYDDDARIVKMELISNEKVIEISGDEIHSALAIQIRNGEFDKINVHIK